MPACTKICDADICESKEYQANWISGNESAPWSETVAEGICMAQVLAEDQACSILEKELLKFQWSHSLAWWGPSDMQLSSPVGCLLNCGAVRETGKLSYKCMAMYSAVSQWLGRSLHERDWCCHNSNTTRLTSDPSTSGQGLASLHPTCLSK